MWYDAFEIIKMITFYMIGFGFGIIGYRIYLKEKEKEKEKQNSGVI